MKREIEAKILNINPPQIKKKLKQLGAKFSGKIKLEQVIWLLELSRNRRGGTIRVRKSSNGTIKLTMKRQVNKGLGYKEWEADVTDYRNTVDIIEQLVPHPYLRLEFSHTREDWQLNGALINIDWFPKIPPLVEIEAEGEGKVREITKLLGFNPSDLVNKGIVTLLIEKLKLKKGDRVKL